MPATVTVRLSRASVATSSASSVWKPQSVFLIYFIAGTLGLSALLLKQATQREAAIVLIQAACVLVIIAILEGLGRGRPRG